ncbi:ABC-three component system protein [Kordia jejudonensis]|uniref:ABC-three component system protein n=1 Tax=Kordia jejudonensis TaxID=1348245 RepID=UPI00069A0868|nr:ABC-three component system protein [Kordia jejudonensis]
MVKARDYLPSDIKRLFAFSGNQCSNPDCARPVIAEDGITVVGKICHIEAASSKGPRYRKEMTDEERRGYNNLILLCDEHHSIIDNKKNEGKFTKELLLEWKENHVNGNNDSELEIDDEIVYKAIDDILFTIERLEKNTEKIYSKVNVIEKDLKRIKGVSDLDQMKSLVEDYKEEVASGKSEFKELFDKIRHFTSNIDKIKQELSEKLDDGGFKDDTDWATELKEAYTMRLLKNDVSLAQQKIHAFLLVKVQMAFRRHVLSAIRNGKNKEEIRLLIDDQVISKVGSYLGYDNVLNLYEDDINGMLYFLTGNCHIKWV